MAEALAGSGEALEANQPSPSDTYQTVSGAGAMLDLAVANPDVDAGQLRRDVTSPAARLKALGMLAGRTILAI